MSTVWAGITCGGRSDTVGRATEAARAAIGARGGILVWENARAGLQGTAQALGLGHNVGHARAVGEMMRRAASAGAEHYLLCCDDAVCQPAYVDAALAAFERDSRIACACTPQMNVGPFPELSPQCERIGANNTRPAEGYILECAFVACVFRLEAMADVGFVDTRYFFHSFDTDTCWTLWANGWRVWQLGREYVEHVHGGKNARDLMDPWANAQFRYQDAWRLFEKWSHADWARIRGVAPYLHEYAVGKHAMNLPWTAERERAVRHLLR